MARKRNSNNTVNIPAITPHLFWLRVIQIVRCAVAYEKAWATGSILDDPRVPKFISKIIQAVDEIQHTGKRGFKKDSEKLERTLHLGFLYKQYELFLKGKISKKELRDNLLDHFKYYSKLLNKIDECLVASKDELRRTEISAAKNSPGKELGPLEIACERLGIAMNLSSSQMMKDWQVRKSFFTDFYNYELEGDKDFEAMAKTALFSTNEYIELLIPLDGRIRYTPRGKKLLKKLIKSNFF